MVFGGSFLQTASGPGVEDVYQTLADILTGMPVLTNTTVYTAAAIWELPPNLIFVILRLIGPGAGGGGAQGGIGTLAIGGGGGAGAYAEGVIPGSSLTENVAITIGAAGTGGTGNTSGGSGGTSSFGSFASVGGGSGGSGAPAGNSAAVTSGGSGGNGFWGSGGQALILSQGNDGQQGLQLAEGLLAFGLGGSAAFGGNHGFGSGYGAGGSGAQATGHSDATGEDGGASAIIVYEYTAWVGTA
jgi:hypothetical protein